MHFEKTCQGFLPSTSKQALKTFYSLPAWIPSFPRVSLWLQLVCSLHSSRASLFSSLKSTCIPFPVPEVLLFPAPQMLFHLFYSFFPMLLLLLFSKPKTYLHMDFLASLESRFTSLFSGFHYDCVSLVLVL